MIYFIFILVIVTLLYESDGICGNKRSTQFFTNYISMTTFLKAQTRMAIFFPIFKMLTARYCARVRIFVLLIWLTCRNGMRFPSDAFRRLA